MPSFETTNSITFREDLFHGVNSYAVIHFYNSQVSRDQDIGYVEKIELNQNIETITETYIGLYGEPSFNAPARVEYFGTLKKKVSESVEDRQGREQGVEDNVLDEEGGYFTNSILNFLDGKIRGSGIKLSWDLKVFTLSQGQRILTIAEDCTVTSHKRTMDRDKFLVDEYSFKFRRFKQRVANRD